MGLKCQACGAPIDANICGYCGQRNMLNAEATQQKSIQQEGQGHGQSPVIIYNQAMGGPNFGQWSSKKSKIVALLLCIFLGYFGAHRFYVGKSGSGLVYLFTGGVGGIGWFIDIILIATGTFKDGFDLPLKQ